MEKNDRLARFHPDVYYHVYNRTNNREPLFKNDRNRLFFLKKYKYYLSNYVDTFAWCLLENHFHFSIRVKPAAGILQEIQKTNEIVRTAAQQQLLLTPEEERDFHPVIERQFTRFFTSYALVFNHEHQRSGNLFYRPFKRIEVSDENHLVWLIYYIHSNIAKHGIIPNFYDYPWSSYPAYLSAKLTHLCKQEVLDWFGGHDRFIAFHGNGINSLPKSCGYFVNED